MMKKTLENRQRFTRKLMQLLVLMAMLLAPKGAWAEASDYDLWVGGVRVTVDNATSGITGSNITNGTVTFDASTNTLTLNGATVTGSYSSGGSPILSRLDALTIVVKGACVLNSTDSCTAIRAEGSGDHALTLKSGDTSCSLQFTVVERAIRDFSSVTLDGLSWNGAYTYQNFSGMKLTKVGDNNETLEVGDASLGVPYGLTVAGVNVTSANATSITGQNITGTVSYRPKTNATTATLTLNGATLPGNVVRTVDEDLVVNFIGLNTINVSAESPYVFVGYGGSTVSSSLTFSASDDFKLTVNNIDHESIIAKDWKSSPVISHSREDVYAYEKDWYAECSSYYVYLYQNKKYNVWYNGIHLCYLKLEPKNGVTFIPESSKVQLSTSNTDTSTDTIKSAIPALTLSVSGATSLASIRYIGDATSAGTLTIAKDEQSSANVNSLTLSDNNGAITGFSDVTISEPLTLRTPTTAPTTWNANIKDVLISDAAIDYGITVAGTQVTSANATHILGENNTTVTFTPAVGETPDTLTLNGVNIEAVSGIVVNNSNDLVIKLKGDNIIEVNDSAIYADVDNPGALTILSGEKGASLGLRITDEESSVIRGFSDLNYDGFLTMNDGFMSVTYKSGDNDGNTKYLYNDENKKAFYVMFQEGVVYPLTIGGQKVTSLNASDFYGDGENPSVSFSPANDTTNPVTPATLTLNSAKIGTTVYPENIVSGLSNLKIHIIGTDSLTGSISSTESSATLTFTATEGAIMDIISATPTSGFSGTPSMPTGYVMLSNETCARIKKLAAPEINVEFAQADTTMFITSEDFGEKFSGATFNYSITYDSQENPSEGVCTNDGVSLDGPCEITADLVYSGVHSYATAKLFGFKDSVVNVGIDESVAIPAVYPAIGSDAISISYSPQGVVVDGQVTGTNIGSTVVSGTITVGEAPAYSILNHDGVLGQFRVNVLPPSPSIAYNDVVPFKEVENNKLYLDTCHVKITVPEAVSSLQNYNVYYSWDPECAIDAGNDYGETGAPFTCGAGKHTLYAWVRANDVYSEKVGHEFDVRTNIDNLTAIDLLNDSTYTQNVIVPTFTLTDAKTETVISADNYDVVYKMVRENLADSVVTAVKDAGTYKVFAVGKGDIYGGEKLVYSEFKVNKASIQGIAVSDTVLTYNGEVQNLVKVTGNVPTGATIKYYCQQIDKDDFDDESFDLNCAAEPGTIIYTEGIPTGKNVGYFAILYIVDGGKNYNDILAGSLLKSAIDSADIAKATIAAIADTAFTGKAIEPELTVTFGQTPMILEVDEDYTVAYTNNINVGTATATITGKGNFKGTQSTYFNIVNRTLDITKLTFHEGWTTFYSLDEELDLPAGYGAYVATNVGNGVVTLTQISCVPKNEPVLLNNATETTTDNMEYPFNLLWYADEDVVVDDNYSYGLHNGSFMRVTGTIPAGKIYLYARVPEAPQLQIVINEGNTTGISGASLVNSEEVKGDLYDLQGRKVVYPKKGLYIKNGRKVVVNNK